MNANELADELEKDTNSYNTMCEAATMLRQQQAEIEALKNRNWDLVSEPWGFDRHSAKTLTDEEIAKVYIETQGLDLIENSPAQINMFTFARAILRKAQEK